MPSEVRPSVLDSMGVCNLLLPFFPNIGKKKNIIFTCTKCMTRKNTQNLIHVSKYSMPKRSQYRPLRYLLLIATHELHTRVKSEPVTACVAVVCRGFCYVFRFFFIMMCSIILYVKMFCKKKNNNYKSWNNAFPPNLQCHLSLS